MLTSGQTAADHVVAMALPGPETRPAKQAPLDVPLFLLTNDRPENSGAWLVTRY